MPNRRVSRVSLWDVVPFVPLSAQRRHAFTYRAAADHKLAPGMRVRIPFGGRTVNGLVLRRARRLDTAAARLKTISVVEASLPLFSANELRALEKLSTLSLEGFSLMAKSAALARRPLEKPQSASPSPQGPPVPRAPQIFGRRRSTFSYRIAWGPLAHALPKKLEGQLLILAPEIAIAQQALRMLKDRDLPVLFFAQTLPVRERRTVLQQLLTHERLAVVSTHAGIFLPFPSLAGILVLETSLPAHRRWDLHPRYDARIAAVTLARAARVPLTLQSSLPSLELFALSRQDALRIFPPRVIPRSFSDPLLSNDTLSAIREALAQNHQVFLFHDIVGTERFYTCDTCGHTLRCETCGGLLEKDADALRCRACGARAGSLPRFCSRCRSPHLGPRRVGTASVSAFLHHLFPQTPIIRLDRETILRRRVHTLPPPPPTPSITIGTERSFSVLNDAQFDCVAILDVDRVLEDSAFAAADHALTVIARVASFRKANGTFLLQTTHPHLPLIRALQTETLATWMASELEDREALGYPPAAAAVRLERDFTAPTQAARTAGRIRARVAAAMPALRTGLRIISGRRPRADLIIRGPLELIEKSLVLVPAGWSTDPYIPLTSLLGDPPPRS